MPVQSGQSATCPFIISCARFLPHMSAPKFTAYMVFEVPQSAGAFCGNLVGGAFVLWTELSLCCNLHASIYALHQTELDWSVPFLKSICVCFPSSSQLHFFTRKKTTWYISKSKPNLAELLQSFEINAILFCSMQTTRQEVWFQVAKYGKKVPDLPSLQSMLYF